MTVIYWELTSTGDFAMTSADAYERGLAALDPETVMEYANVPWDLYFLREWINEILLDDEDPYDFIETHFHVGGASPGGNIDGYTPRDIKNLLQVLEQRGHELVRTSIFDRYADAMSDMMADYDE
jgi:hypothetical protein